MKFNLLIQVGYEEDYGYAAIYAPSLTGTDLQLAQVMDTTDDDYDENDRKYNNI
jgi:hypothetical protein